jgi:excisionase family DNA binding protein
MTEPRFLRLADVAEILNISAAQAYALVRNGELPAMKIGGRGQWRVERDQLEAFIKQAHEQTRDFVAKHPFGRDEALDEETEDATARQSGRDG